MKTLMAIVPDFREALEEGLEQAAEKVVIDLKREGPYWSGQFESLWQVNPGKRAVSANIATAPFVPRRALPRKITPIDVPKSPNLGGYTIGNRAQYRIYAMDLKPTPRGRQGGNAPNATAPPNWFDTYYNTRMHRVIDSEIRNVFRRYK